MKTPQALPHIRRLISVNQEVTHWLTQRLTAVVLAPLGLWFMGCSLTLVSASYDEACSGVSSPWSMTWGTLFLSFLFYHGYLGLQVILQDYLSNAAVRRSLLLALKIVSIGAGVLGIICLLKVALQHVPSL